MSSEAITATLRVTQALEHLEVPYVIGGSMASTAYGRVRATMDVDILAALREEHVDPLVAELRAEFYADAEMIREAIANQSSFNLIHLATMFKADIFVAGARAFDEQQIARRQTHLLAPPDQAAFVSSVEDVILAKLEWYRRGGEVSERQWRDVQGVLDVQGDDLDYAYLELWANSLGVTDLLRRTIEDYRSRRPMD